MNRPYRIRSITFALPKAPASDLLIHNITWSRVHVSFYGGGKKVPKNPHAFAMLRSVERSTPIPSIWQWKCWWSKRDRALVICHMLIVLGGGFLR